MNKCRLFGGISTFLTHLFDMKELFNMLDQLNELDTGSKEYRQKLRMLLLGNAIFDDVPITIVTADFNGYGDSGTVENALSQEGDQAELYQTVNEYLESLVHAHVTWDWYNNEGGGGDITWDLQTDKITINGYYNVVDTVSQEEIEL